MKISTLNGLVPVVIQCSKWFSVVRTFEFSRASNNQLDRLRAVRFYHYFVEREAKKKRKGKMAVKTRGGVSNDGVASASRFF